MRQPSGHGIWEELKSNCVTQSSSVRLLSRSAFDFPAVVAQFGLPIREQVAKIHHRFAVHSCDLRPFYSCCHALDSSANEIYSI